MLGLSPKPHIMYSSQYQKWISIVVPPYPGRMTEYEVYRMHRAQEFVDRWNKKLLDQRSLYMRKLQSLVNEEK